VRVREVDVRTVVRRASVASAAIAVALSPIPFADEVALLPVYLGLAARVGRAHTLSIRRVPWRAVFATTALGLTARAAVNAPFALVPGVDAAVNALTAAALTEVLGAYFDEACARPDAATRAPVRLVCDVLAARLERRAPAPAG
jgi:uncharacterized protein (DUF697 family)